jgi:hypothetical protein
VIKNVVSFTGILALAASPLLADFTYQEKTTVTGGAMLGMMRVAGVFSKQLREPMESTVSVKGDRMIHRSTNHTTIIDLASETITTVDPQKKQYTVMTFAEMQQMMQQAQEKMKQKDKGEMKFKVSAKSTGQSRQVAGFDAKEMVMTMEMEGTDKESGQKGGMTVITDMWIAPGVAGYQEVRDFYKRMATKINWAPGGNMFAQNPQVSEGMAEVYKEVAKVDGVPVMQVIKMGPTGTVQPPDGSAPPPAAQPQPAPAGPSVGGALGGALGGRFGLGRKKSSTNDPPPAAAGNSQQQSGSLIEMTTELSSFSSNPVDAAQFEIPSNYKRAK